MLKSILVAVTISLVASTASANDFCDAFGGMAEEIALARDKGVTRDEADTVIMAATDIGSIVLFGLRVVETVYESPQLSPEVIREVHYFSCMSLLTLNT